MSEIMFDLRLAYINDNPFEKDMGKNKLNIMKQYIRDHNTDFIDFNYLNDSRYLEAVPKMSVLYNVPVNKQNFHNNPIMNDIKGFIKSVPGISKEMSTWCNLQETIINQPQPKCKPQVGGNVSDEPVSVPIVNGSVDTSVGNSVDEDVDDIDVDDYAEIVPKPSSFGINYSMGLQYNAQSDQAVSFEDVTKICMNIARTRLADKSDIHSETVMALEKDRRKGLVRNVIHYLANRNISSFINTNENELQDLTMEQLENLLEQCRERHEHCKVMDCFKQGLDLAGTVYSQVFPEGIPIGKTRRLQFNGVGKEIMSQLLTTSTTTGTAFANILRKHNIHVSDELLTLVAIGKICCSNVTIVNTNDESEDIAEEDEGEDVEEEDEGEDVEEYDN